jgi:short subunit dehydrogenase-like uncharacterized protein
MTSVDIALLGATGFTGGLTADYLAAHMPPGASWAIAGRNQAKLEAVADRVERLGGVRPEIIPADIGNAESMAALAGSTRVLVTTVGPYLTYGEAAVKASVEAGISYVDLTGEPQFVDDMWLKYHDRAVETGARIIHACGFDSIPYDLGVLFAVEQLPKDVPITVRGYIRVGAEFSGGTYHSAINQFASMRESGRIAAARRRAEPRPEGRKVRGSGKLGKAAELGGWGVPLPTIDPQIVLRSARALERYGPDFSFAHFAHFKTRRMLAASGLALGVAFIGAQLPPTRALLYKFKGAGTGPSDEKREKSWFRFSVFAEGGGQKVHAEVMGGDPGYTETAKMLAESALCLAYDDLPKVSGQTTTAVAMGDVLIDRLRRAGITFRTVAAA